MMGEAASFALRIARLGQEVEAIGPAHLKSAASEVRTIILASIAQAAGPDLALSHVRSKAGVAAKLGAKLTMVNDPAAPSATLQATGPLQLLDNKAKPHIISGKGTAAQRRKSKARVKSGKSRYTLTSPRLNTPRGPRFMVHHPGHAGQHSWLRGEERAARRVGIILSESYRRTVATLGGN